MTITLESLLVDEDLDQKTLERIARKYAGCSIYISKRAIVKQMQWELYNEQKRLGLSKKGICRVFQVSLGLSRSGAYRALKICEEKEHETAD